MIRFVRGNLFDSQADALVNTVNCVGVMGKGIAYQFKRAYPDMFKSYRSQCAKGEIRLGEVTQHRVGSKLIINFPTKKHWKSKSKLKDIRTGLESLRTLLEEERVSSIAIPPLGCGNGGLRWPDVRRLIEDNLGDLSRDVDIEVYEPVGQFNSEVAQKPKLSLSHFVLAQLAEGLHRPSKLGLQKTAYFFNVYSEQDYFKFTEYRFGPFCMAIDHMSRTIKDYLDFTGLKRNQLADVARSHELAGRDLERLESWSTYVQAATQFTNLHKRDMELLATLHAVLRRDEPATEEALIEAFLKWSSEKSQRFGADDVRRGLKTLEQEGLAERMLWGIRPTVPSSTTNGITPTRHYDLDLPAALFDRLRQECDQLDIDANRAIEKALREWLVGIAADREATADQARESAEVGPPSRQAS